MCIISSTCTDPLLRHPAHIVAAEVDEHDVLGALLGVGEQFVDKRVVFGVVLPRVARTGDRAAPRTSPFSTRTSISGEAPMIEAPSTAR